MFKANVSRAVVLFFCFHALGTETWLVKQSFQEVLYFRVPWGIITGNIKVDVKGVVRVKGTFVSVSSTLPVIQSFYLCSLKKQRIDSPEESVLFSVHPGLQLQSRVLPKWRYDEAEEQGEQHKYSRQNNLKKTKRCNQLKEITSLQLVLSNNQ